LGGSLDAYLDIKYKDKADDADPIEAQLNEIFIQGNLIIDFALVSQDFCQKRSLRKSLRKKASLVHLEKKYTNMSF